LSSLLLAYLFQYSQALRGPPEGQGRLGEVYRRRENLTAQVKSRHNLLRKIEIVPEKLAHILNLHGFGYLFERPRFNRETATQMP